MYEEEYMKEQQIQELQDIFDKLDKDKDGKILCKELSTAMQSLGQNPSNEGIHDFLAEMGLNENSKINFDYFIAFMTRNSVQDQIKDEVINAFRAFDKDGKGYISSVELKHIMMSIGDKMTEEEVDEMVKQAEIDDNGMIYYEKFVSDMTPA